MEKGQDGRVPGKIEGAAEKWRKGIRTDGARITAEKILRRREGDRGRQSVSD